MVAPLPLVNVEPLVRPAGATRHRPARAGPIHNQRRNFTRSSFAARAVFSGALLGALFSAPLQAQTLLDPERAVSIVVGGLSQPMAMVFIGPDNILVTEKASGQVKRVTGGVVTGAVLDLAVNSKGERGLLDIALHPSSQPHPGGTLYNTESTTGTDSNVEANVPLMGNRVDRFVWNGSSRAFDRNSIRLRAFQNDRNNVANAALRVPRGNHNGGVLHFGPDGKLYVIIGDAVRRGWMQNILNGLITNSSTRSPTTNSAARSPTTRT